MERWSVLPVPAVLAIAVGCLGVGYGASLLVGFIQKRNARREAEKLLDAARQEGEEVRKKAEVAGSGLESLDFEHGLTPSSSAPSRPGLCRR